MTTTAVNAITCRIGDFCAFQVNISSGLGAQYTKAKFVVRSSPNEAQPVWLQVDETSGIEFDYDSNNINVTLGASKTGAIPDVTADKSVAALLRLYNPIDDDDTLSFLIPFVVQPDLIPS